MLFVDKDINFISDLSKQKIKNFSVPILTGFFREKWKCVIKKMYMQDIGYLGQ